MSDDQSSVGERDQRWTIPSVDECERWVLQFLGLDEIERQHVPPKHQNGILLTMDQHDFLSSSIVRSGGPMSIVTKDAYAIQQDTYDISVEF